MVLLYIRHNKGALMYRYLKQSLKRLLHPNAKSHFYQHNTYSPFTICIYHCVIFQCCPYRRRRRSDDPCCPLDVQNCPLPTCSPTPACSKPCSRTRSCSVPVRPRQSLQKCCPPKSCDLPATCDQSKECNTSSSCSMPTSSCAKVRP